jgi:hypothetical protein
VIPYTGRPPEMLAGLQRVGLLLQAAAGLVLLIGCANVASLQLGAAAQRSNETSVRIALGASRGRLASSALIDSLVISLAGGALGVLLAKWTLQILPALLFQEDAASLVQAPDMERVLLWSLAALTIITVCGLTSQAHPSTVLRQERGGSKGGRRLCSVLVVVQMAACCLLVVSAGYLHQGFRTAIQTSASRALSEPMLATVQADPNVGLDYFRSIERGLDDPAAGPAAGLAIIPHRAAWPADAGNSASCRGIYRQVAGLIPAAACGGALLRKRGQPMPRGDRE